MGPSLGSLGTLWGLSGGSLGSLGALWRLSGGSLGALWGLSGGSLGNSLAALWGLSDALWGALWGTSGLAMARPPSLLPPTALPIIPPLPPSSLYPAGPPHGYSLLASWALGPTSVSQASHVCCARAPPHHHHRPRPLPGTRARAGDGVAWRGMASGLSGTLWGLSALSEALWGALWALWVLSGALWGALWGLSGGSLAEGMLTVRKTQF